MREVVCRLRRGGERAVVRKAPSQVYLLASWYPRHSWRLRRRPAGRGARAARAARAADERARRELRRRLRLQPEREAKVQQRHHGRLHAEGDP
eukprot:scaffold68696_cov60-Phaeocystis_antarctica.AAC.1